MARKNKVLVTGGAGYIGSHTAVELIKKGYEVVIIDNLSNSDQTGIEGIAKITGSQPAFFNVDLCQSSALNDFFSHHSTLDVVIHFAAFKSVEESVKHPLRYYHNNLCGLINLLQCIDQYNINKMVFSSSCTVYGDPTELPVSEEEDLKKATNPYGSTKQISEDILFDQSKSTSLSTISLRYFNPIGAHESGLIGDNSKVKATNLLPLLAKTAAGRRTALQVYGTDYDTKDGTCIRDYIHVVDLAKAHVSAIERLLSGNNQFDYEVFNLGTGKGYSVKEVVKAFEKVTGKKVTVKYAPRRAGDVPIIYSDCKKAERDLNWIAENGIDEMVRSAWNYELKSGNN